MTYVKECPKCHREFQAESERHKVCPDCKRAVGLAAVHRWREKNRDEINARLREKLKADDAYRQKMREQARRRYAAKHPMREHHCIECGALLQAPNAKRCPRCAQEKQREIMREWARNKRAELKAEKNKQAETTMDESVSRAKQANVKIQKAHRMREDDARQKAAAVEKRIAAGVAMLKDIYVRRQAEKRKKKAAVHVSFPHVCECDCAAWTGRDWW